MQSYSDLSVLIIDPNPAMRGNLHNMLNQASITRIEYAVSSGTAIRQLTNKRFDVILCEYDLGSGNDDNGQDGQQLLEDLRHHKLIDRSAIFIMALNFSRTAAASSACAPSLPNNFGKNSGWILPSITLQSVTASGPPRR